MTSDDHVRLPRPRRAVEARRHDTFAVLRRAREAVDRAEVVLTRARERSAHHRLAHPATELPRPLEDAVLQKLRDLLGLTPAPPRSGTRSAAE